MNEYHYTVNDCAVEISNDVCPWGRGASSLPSISVIIRTGFLDSITFEKATISLEELKSIVSYYKAFLHAEINYFIIEITLESTHSKRLTEKEFWSYLENNNSGVS